VIFVCFSDDVYAAYRRAPSASAGG